VVKEYDIEIINAQSSLDRYTSVFARWRYGLDVKVVHTRRQMSLSMGGGLNKLIYYRGTDKIIAVSEPVKASLVKQGIPASHIKVIHNGTPTEKYTHLDDGKIKELKEKLHIQEGDIVIGCCARLKHQEQILQALQYVKEKTKVIFVGIEDQKEFQKYYTLLPHEIHIIGANVPNLEALHYIKLFTLNILPSTMEGLSQSLLEAMALGVPVIATAFAGNLDLIRDGENGLLFEHENIQQLAEKIELLIHQPALRKKLATAGQKTALEEFSIERTIDNYAAFFADLIGKQK
jgi:glycosyltransferase involved in cell wall biosynthesis